MNLSKHDPETEMEMNMTPMIDVVFLLIIFFMIITDLTQQDLEDLELPMVVHAVEDKPDPNIKRPIVNILFDGKIIVSRDVLYDPEVHGQLADPYEDLNKFLTLTATSMKDRQRKDGEDDTLPDDPLMIRADMSTPFKYIQLVMEKCAAKGIQIWKVQLAASVPSDNASNQ